MGDRERLSSYYLSPMKRMRLVLHNRAERLRVAANGLLSELDKKIKRMNYRERKKWKDIKKNYLKKFNRKERLLKKRCEPGQEGQSEEEVYLYYQQTALCSKLERGLNTLYEEYRGAKKDELLVMNCAPAIDQMDASSGWIRLTGDVMALGSTEAGKDTLEDFMTALYEKRREGGQILVDDDIESDIEGSYVESDVEGGGIGDGGSGGGDSGSSGGDSDSDGGGSGGSGGGDSGSDSGSGGGDSGSDSGSGGGDSDSDGSSGGSDGGSSGGDSDSDGSDGSGGSGESGGSDGGSSGGDSDSDGSGGDDSSDDGDDSDSGDDRGDDRSGCGDGGNEEIDSFDRMMGYVQESTHALQREIDEESEESLATKWTPPTLVHQVNKKRGRKKTIKWIRSMAAREREMCPPLPMTNQQYRLLNYMYLSTVQRIVLWRTYKKRVSMKREIVEKELQLSNNVSQVTKGTVKGVSDSYKKKTSDELQGKGMTYKEQLSGIQELSESA